jgi:carboxyl-terminal processing protease
LASALVQPGVGIEEIFRDVRGKVMKATGDKQIPWDSSSLTAPFFFKPASAQFTTATQPAPAPQPAAKPASATTGAASGNTEMELTYWKSIESSKQASDYQAYLEQFPNGTFAGLARSRLAQLGQGAPREQPATPTVQEPAAAPVVTKTPPAPEPTAEPVSTSVTTDEDASDGIERDSHGVDCRIMDATRSESDCRKTKKFSPANKPGGYGGGKTSGSHGWN